MTSGISAYVRNMLQALAARDPRNEYILYSNRDIRFEPPARWRKRTRGLFPYGSLWVQAELPRWLAQDQVDVYWGTEYPLPLGAPRQTRLVLTMHDLVHVLYPETMSTLNLALSNLLLARSVARADAIVTISDSTRIDLQRLMRPRTRLVRVIPLGVNGAFSARDQEQARTRVEQRYPGLSPYVLTVGTFEPRKNVGTLVRAFQSIAARIPHRLAIAGGGGWKHEPLLSEIERGGLGERVRRLGYVPDDALPDLYAGADAFVFPSLYEGFGLPPLEALASGVPVVCSNASSLPEVVGDAAVLVDPREPESIAAGLLRVLEDPALRRSLVASGLERASQLTWDRAAAALQDVFDEVAAS
jgi:glycosyltransferase involved in cell wall biosynthesis